MLAESTYDAAHPFVVEAKQERPVALPALTLATSVRSRDRRTEYIASRDLALTALDRGAPRKTERSEGLSVLQAPDS